MNSYASSSRTPRQKTEAAALAALELRRRLNERRATQPVVYGIFEPLEGVHGGRHLYSVQRQPSGSWAKVDLPYQVTLPLKLEPVLYAKQRFIVLVGGRGGAKSQSVADMLLARVKDERCKVMCLREFQNSIEDSVHSLLKTQAEARGFDGFDVGKATITYKSDSPSFRFKGIARDPDAVKSAHGFSAFWVEEAQTLSEESQTKLTPTVREAGSQVIFTANPGSAEDPFSQRFIVPFLGALERDGIYQDDLHLVIKLNYSDNPWHRELEDERVYDQAHKRAAEYRHVWLGEFHDQVEGSIIEQDWFDAAIDAHLKKGWPVKGAKVVAHDPSDQGTDPKGLVVLQGSVILEAVEGSNAQMDVNDGMDWALDRTRQEQADLFAWDVDGLGAGLRRQVQLALDGTRTDYIEFRGGGGIVDPLDPIDEDAPGGRINEDTYPNRRSQEYFRLAKRFHNTYRAVVNGDYVDPDKMISVSSGCTHLDKLRAELCRVPRRQNPRGMHQIMSKPEMRQRFKLASPNLADSVMMATAAAAQGSTQWGSLPEQDMRWIV